MTSDGVNSYTWDRANRLLSMGGVSYQYDGQDRRVQQTVSSTVTKYLLDIQPGLSVVLSETTGLSVVRNIHAPKGIHARKDASSNWHWLMQDGLGSVRAEVSNAIAVEGSQNFAPYGSSVDALGSFGTYGFTGEPTDVNGLVYDRARYYVPSIGMFASLDPFEGFAEEPMSINGYGYVHGNPINLTDPSGKFVTVIAGAAVGFGVGAAVGFASTAAFLALAQSGACGCRLQQQVQSMSPLETLGFLGRSTLGGAAVGGILGAIAGLGPLGLAISGGITTGLGVNTLADAWNERNTDGPNICNFGKALLGIAGIVGGATTVINNVPGAINQGQQIVNNYTGNGSTNSYNSAGTGTNPNYDDDIHIGQNLDFVPPYKYVNQFGEYTTGRYTIDESGMAPHLTGPTSTSRILVKSQFLYKVDAYSLTLDAAHYADYYDLWQGNKAKVFANNGPIGVVENTGELTSWLNIYRTSFPTSGSSKGISFVHSGQQVQRG